MKKKLILVTALAGLFLLGGCQSGNSATEEKVLRVGTEGTYAPFSYRNEENELVGYDVEVAEAVAEKIGYQVEFVDAPWDSMLAAFDAEKSDVIFNQVSITDERKEKYDFTIPYSVSHASLITNEADDTIQSFDDLKGKKSAQSLTSNYAVLAEEYGAELVSTDGFSKSAELVANGQADATLNDDVTYYDYINQQPDAPLKLVQVSDETTEVGAMLHKGNEELIEEINQALQELKDDGTLTKLSTKYFDKDISQ
ncbi:amino acid ABC transporter substrate-binding protein [Enterococcus sp. 669A]|uniref:Amino acid ABC transporter substrate-binding protein n=1 Tax=Candidatus Enterococcus moelleringii TaxID=2815325 RepID=A0ABS3LG16_9ENTE|nr:amino acid ABC transporter substrate-binding protein [Enterococcus sp. 669A]MBO1307968.1 amino acid ABC transporter substrate-binding protein [Enterococcus sp. 669A]